MKKIIRSRLVAAMVVVGLALASIQCGYILYPERRGQSGGEIDVEVLIMDCLWLIVGIVPGVVALVVDFTTGAIYEPGTAMNVRPGGSLVFMLDGAAPADAALEMSLRGEGRDLVLVDEDFEKGETIKTLSMKFPEDLAPGAYTLEVSVNGKVNASWPVNVN